MNKANVRAWAKCQLRQPTQVAVILIHNSLERGTEVLIRSSTVSSRAGILASFYL